MLTACASDACANKSNTPKIYFVFVTNPSWRTPCHFPSQFIQHFCSHLEYSLSATWQYTISNEFRKWILSRNLWKQVYNMVTTHNHSMYFAVIQNYNPHVKYFNLPKRHNLLPKFRICLLPVVQTQINLTYPLLLLVMLKKISDFHIFIYIRQRPIRDNKFSQAV
jgi:hypothetical protein